MTVLAARWLFPGDGPPLPDVELEIRDGRIREIRSHVAAGRSSAPGSVMIPGLINAHTHLEFSDLPATIQPLRDAAGWIRAVVASRSLPRPPLEDRLSRGARESLNSGVTVLADIVTSDLPESRISSSNKSSPLSPCVIPFREILGLRAADIPARLVAARKFLEETATLPVRGISPHAPYSLHPELFEGLCRLAEKFEVPAMMHLAEMPAELELLRNGEGPLVNLFREWNLWDGSEQPRGRRPLDFLRRLAHLPRTLIAHGNLLDSEEVDFLAAHPRMSVAYCPRTHAAMQTGIHPWREMLARGINVALGTDSRATNPDLSLWNELGWLQKPHPDLTAQDLLALATVNGARALGLPDRGTLAPGNLADLCLVQLPAADADPCRALFHGKIGAVMAQGVWRELAGSPVVGEEN